jgi:hypothetical protein
VQGAWLLVLRLILEALAAFDLCPFLLFFAGFCMVSAKFQHRERGV